jgi:hypothetical protein
MRAEHYGIQISKMNGFVSILTIIFKNKILFNSNLGLQTDFMRGFCNGDAGNPVVSNIAGVRTLTGVISSTTCGTNGNPTLVTRLEDVRIRNWIQWVVGV